MSASGLKKGSGVGIKVISSIMVVGGIAGIVLALWTEARTQKLGQLIFLGFAFLLFGATVWAGIELWNGKPRGYMLAKLLFLLQIPIISIHGFAYQFYVGLVLNLSITQDAASKLNLGFEIGSLLNFQISPELESLVFGANLVAVGALIYLVKRSYQNVAPGASPDR